MRARTTAAVVATSALALGVTTLTTGTAQAASGSTWDRLAQCESGGNWSINTGNGFSGGLQFTASTWRAYGGTAYASSAYKAGRSAQIVVAERVLAGQGWGAWPACSAKLGLRGKAGAGSSTPAPAHRAASVHRASPAHRAPQVSRSEVRKASSAPRHAATPHRAPVVRSAPKVAPAPGATYVVKAGDTLSAIAARHRVAGGWQSVYALNRAQIGTDPNLIFPGQRLRLH